MKEILDGEETFTEKETREKDLLIAFVGIQHDYFLDKWKDMDQIIRSFNIAAFFLTFLWFLYRKMYLEFIIFLVVLIAWIAFDLSFLEPILSVPVFDVYNKISTILVGFIFGVFSNYLYLKSAQRKINKLKMEGYSESELFKKVKKAGGTSILSVIIVFVALCLLTFFLLKSGYLD